MFDPLLQLWLQSMGCDGQLSEAQATVIRRHARVGDYPKILLF
ncbi:MAG TPA: hypothetical protein VHV55_26500 [Pirellulales bacterium]|nr:hypothetical protein [Pirellulales bacterium]